ncbi:MAG: hypothetical protein KKF44_06075 [Nanoarchaeota archaeon]|nr:hypothetical protein [Nanoarchaeota archaeon]
MKRDKIAVNMIGLLIVSLLLASAIYAQASPSGAQIIYNSTETKQSEPASFINTTGGSFTTLILYGETQNPRWKAYVGNVTGKFVLDDADNYTLYEWDVTTVTGEVYASRASSITWADIACATQDNITSEEDDMNHTTSSKDSINSTFQYQIHKEFYVGTTYIANSTCRSTATWVNNTVQSVTEDSLFQEMLLSDGPNLVYATILHDEVTGFNYKDYDFQMIVAEVDSVAASSTPYYFWVELA